MGSIQQQYQLRSVSCRKASPPPSECRSRSLPGELGLQRGDGELEAEAAADVGAGGCGSENGAFDDNSGDVERMDQKAALRDAWAHLGGKDRVKVLADAMYGRLLARDAAARRMFSDPSDLAAQKRTFPAALRRLLVDPNPAAVAALAARHAHMNVRPEQVDVFIDCASAAVLEALGQEATPAVRGALTAAFDTLSADFKRCLTEALAALDPTGSDSPSFRDTTSSDDDDRTGDACPPGPPASPVSRPVPSDHAGYLYEVTVRHADAAAGACPKPTAVLPPPRASRQPLVAAVATTTTGVSSAAPSRTLHAATRAVLHPGCHTRCRRRLPCGEPAPEPLPLEPRGDGETLAPGRPADDDEDELAALAAAPEGHPQPQLPAGLDRVAAGARVVRKRRWLEIKGQYLFYYTALGRTPLRVVDLSRAVVTENDDVGFSWALHLLSESEEHPKVVYTLGADGDHDKELWVVRLKRACARFSFVRPVQVGMRVTVDVRGDAAEMKPGCVLWSGSLQGTTLSWKGKGLWIGVELDDCIEGGHSGTFRGVRFFECSPGHGVLLPAYRVRILLPDEEKDKLKITSGRHRLQHYEPLAVLGCGSFGCVYKVRDRVSGAIYACKVLQKGALVREGQVSNLHRERSILLSVSHPYIVKLHSAFQTENRVLLLFDFLSGGELWFHLSRASPSDTEKDLSSRYALSSCPSKENDEGASPEGAGGGEGGGGGSCGGGEPPKTGFFSERVARFYFAEVCSAVAHLHLAGVMHRDLKLENLVLDHAGHVVLTDFGFAKRADPGDPGSNSGHPLATAQCGTLPYMAPEILEKNGYGKEVDCWALGVVLFIMTTGCYPFWASQPDGSLDREATIRQILEERDIKKGEFPDAVPLSPEAVDLICRLLDKDPGRRLADFGVLRRHAWFAGFDWPACEKRRLAPPFVPDLKGSNTKYFSKRQQLRSGFAELALASKADPTLRPPTDFAGAQPRTPADCPFAHFNAVRHPSSTLSEDFARDTLSHLQYSQVIFEADA
ncbi:RAC family serine/threonine-protein kinase-like protein [Diplonema papillatum]|nr:RAC family serine/threonine-protein kinase-like protein [Diplonema papillatum]KAJ9450131.1 RAC family serine/threonine-protein kinase-like protein [Diplonema papillatum]